LYLFIRGLNNSLYRRECGRKVSSPQFSIAPNALNAIISEIRDTVQHQQYQSDDFLDMPILPNFGSGYLIPV
uniref:Transposase n=1 Tax=Haemonchus placei TaxID=6290 RepID=A0A0N4W5R2_HAEPC